ncbi:hypothetical protein EDD18DRAFT_859814 [Armillaria luteobubalina]|uniref:Uncharacterized protein n=1 Tax=Armillaria luteobubalina TaxID=153913 RepID=A0AA39QCR8_9AGAR|nr:hypothetical protein EDD18DRAFT_859814 [Armillaria luteobubalina]
MSLERTNGKGAFTAESYRQNSESIQAMRAHLDRAWANNEMAELERKVREGEDAKQKLSELQKLAAAEPEPVRPSNIPSIEPVQPTAYIEEVGYDHQLSSSRPVYRHPQPSTHHQSHRNTYMNYVPTPHGVYPLVAQDSANLANRHPHIYRQTTSTSGPVGSRTNSVQLVHRQGGHDFRTSSLANALGGTPSSHMQDPGLHSLPRLHRLTLLSQTVCNKML